MQSREERKAYQKAYRIAHREELNAKLKTYLATHPEKARAYKKTYRASHREEIKARAKAYGTTHREEAKTYHVVHRERDNARSRTRRTTHPQESRAAKLLRNYGISPMMFNDLFDKQGGVCAICGTDKFNGHGPQVDHDHGSRKTVRGILCQNCNLALGLIHDNIKTGRSMIAYLERWEKTTEEIA